MTEDRGKEIGMTGSIGGREKRLRRWAVYRMAFTCDCAAIGFLGSERNRIFARVILTGLRILSFLSACRIFSSNLSF